MAVKKKVVRKKVAKKKVAHKKTVHKRKVRRLYRADEKDSMIGGVCAGLAHYFGWDPIITRLIAVVLALLDGIGIIAYLLAWILIPRRA